MRRRRWRQHKRLAAFTRGLQYVPAPFDDVPASELALRGREFALAGLFVGSSQEP